MFELSINSYITKSLLKLYKSSSSLKNLINDSKFLITNKSCADLSKLETAKLLFIIRGNCIYFALNSDKRF